MAKQNMVYTYSGTLFSLKKGNSDNAPTEMILEDIIPSDIRESQKDKCCMMPHI